jgi:hypothetical protein
MKGSLVHPNVEFWKSFLFNDPETLEEARRVALSILKEEIERALKSAEGEFNAAVLKALESLIKLAECNDPERSSIHMVKVIGIIRAAENITL